MFPKGRVDLDRPAYKTFFLQQAQGTAVRSAQERYDFEFKFRLDIAEVARLGVDAGKLALRQGRSAGRPA